MTAETPHEAGDAPTLRDRARAAVREEVLRHAWDLFVAQGFEATTIEEIVAASGMSRRTFFRYFSGKDELVLERMVTAGAKVAAALGAQPPSEAAWPALRAAFEPIVRAQEQRPQRSRTLQQMLRSEPTLRGTVVERRQQWESALAPLVALRLPSSAAEGDPRPRAIAAAAIACLEIAQDLWLDLPGASLGDLLDEAMTAVAPLAGGAG